MKTAGTVSVEIPILKKYPQRCLPKKVLTLS